MLQQGNLYQHMSMLDIQVYIVSPGLPVPDGFVYQVRYYNPRLKSFQPDNKTLDSVVIKREDAYKWVKMS